MNTGHCALTYIFDLRLRLCRQTVATIFLLGPIRETKREFWEDRTSSPRNAERGTRRAFAFLDGKSRNRRAVHILRGGSANTVKFAKQSQGRFRKGRIRRVLPPDGNATPRSGITASPAHPSRLTLHPPRSRATIQSIRWIKPPVPANAIFFVKAHN